MKYLIIAFFLPFNIVSCPKGSNNCNCSGPKQQCATIIKVVGSCNNFGIKINGQEYPSSDIPASFRVANKKVCVEYDLYEDMRLCACCGGTWADIKSMSQSN